jgi:hypothetical protein
MITAEDRDALRTEYEDEAHVLLDAGTMRGLFDGPVTKITSLLTAQLTQLKESQGEQCSVVGGCQAWCNSRCSACLPAISALQVILVGGFASSPYLKQRVETAALALRLAESVMVPPLASAAVMIGEWAAAACRQLAHSGTPTLTVPLCSVWRRGLHLWPQPGPHPC